MTEPRQEALTHRQILVVLAGLWLGMILSALDQTVLTTALPAIVGDLGGVGSLSWVVTSYIVAQTACVPVFGKLGDILGRKRVFQASVVLFLVGSVVCGTATTMAQLIGGRVIQGVGAGGIAALNWTIIGDIISPRHRGKYQGYSAAVFAVSVTLGPLMGGFLVDHLSWRWTFFVNLPLGLLSVVVTQVGLRVAFRRVGHVIDWRGAALLVAGVVCVLLVTEWGGTEHPWLSPTIVALAAVGAALLAAFVWQERRSEEPIVPPRLFHDRVVRVTVATAALGGYTQYAALVYAPLTLQIVQGVTATDSGALMLPQILAFLVASAGAGQLISRTGHYKAFPAVGLAITVAGISLFARLDPGASRTAATVALVLIGGGLGMIQQVLIVATQNAVGHRDLGTATSTVGFARFMGGALGVAVTASLLVSRLDVHLARFVGTSADELDVEELRTSPEQLDALPAAVHDGVVQAFSASLEVAYLAVIPVAVIGILVASRLEYRPLREWAHVGHGAETPEPAAAGAARLP